MHNNPIVEYELKKQGLLQPTWENKDDYILIAWHEIVKENEILKARIKELEERLKKYEGGDRYEYKKSI